MFAQASAQFAIRGISSEQTKYSHVISTLPFEVAQEVRDILINPATGQYAEIKTWLIERTTAF